MKLLTSTSAVRTAFITCLLALLPLNPCHAASNFELDIKELDKDKPPKAEPKKKPGRLKPAQHATPAKKFTQGEETHNGNVRYTVKKGDHIFKILLKDFGLSNNDAERLIPEIARINKIENIRKLSVGQVLLVPSVKSATRKEHAKKHVRHKERVTQKHEVSREAAVEEVKHSRRSKKREIDSKQQSVEVAATESPATRPSPAPEPEPSPTPAVVPPPLPLAGQNPATPVVSSLLPIKVEAITATNPEDMVDALLKALAIDSRKKWIVDVNAGNNGSMLSIKVDRYFEEGGKRYIINCTAKDQFNYTLLRLLERVGYKVIQAESEDFRKVAGALLEQLSWTHEYVARKIGPETGGREVAGYLVGDGKKERQLFLTDSRIAGN